MIPHAAPLKWNCTPGTPPEMGEVCDGGIVRLPSGRDVRIYYYCATTPTPVPGLRDVVEISAGEYTVCARRRDGTVWCWGGNDSIETPSGPTLGTIGDGLPNTERCMDPPMNPPEYMAVAPCRRRPARVVGITAATALSVGTGRAGGVQNGQVWCWGYWVGPTLNSIETATASAVPVPVRLPPLRRDQ